MKKTILYISCIASMFWAKESEAQIIFNGPTNYPTGSNPHGITSNDFNNDGIKDLAIANDASNNITILRGTGNGAFNSPFTFAAGANPTDVALGDFNNDGAMDLVAPNSSTNTVSVLLGNGSGLFSAPTAFNCEDQPMYIAVADLNHDSNLDIAVSNSNSGTVSILLGNGTGNFAAAINKSCGPNPSTLIIADLNNDSNLDIAVTNTVISGNIQYIYGDGTGGFSNPAFVFAGDYPTGLSCADVNSDGNVDFVFGNSQISSAGVLLGDGQGNFSIVTNFLAGTSPNATQIADFNGDGKKDILAVNVSSNDFSILLGNGSGSFSSPTNFPIGSNTGSIAAAIADFNNDGKIDLATANSFTNNSSVFINGSFPPAASLNFDGADDYITVNQSGSMDNLTQSAFTLEAWVNPSDVSSVRSIIRKSGDYSLYLNNGVLTAEVWANGMGDPYFEIYTASTVLSTNTWSHVALTYNHATGAVKLYVNGVIEPLAVNTNSINASEQLAVGASANYGNNFVGNIDEVRIWNTERSTCQINAAKNCELFGTQNGLLLYYKFNQGFAGANNMITNATDSSGFNNLGFLNGFSLFGNSSNWSAPGGVASDVSCGFVISGITANSPIICVGDTATVIATGAINYTWSNNMSTNDTIIVTPTSPITYTITGSDNHGCTLAANTTVNVNPLPILSLTTASTCTGATVTLTASGANTYVWSNGDTGPSTTFSATSSATYTVTGTDINSCISIDSTTVTVNTPSLVASVSINASNTSIVYGTNVIFTATPTNGGASPSYIWKKNNVTVGNSTSTYSSNALLNHDTITCAIVSSDACVLTNSSSNKIGMTVVTNNSSLAFDGVNDHVVIPTNSLVNNLSKTNLTIEAWINVNNITNDMSILSKNGDYSFWISNGVLQADIWPAGMGSSAVRYYSGTTALTPNTWAHVALTWDKAATTAKFYINGVAQTPSVVTGTDNAPEPMWLGASNLFGTNFLGKIDEVHIWKTTRTAAEVLNDSKCNFQSAQTNLVASYNFNEGTPGSNNSGIVTLLDNSNNNNGALTSFALTGSTSNWVADAGTMNVYPTIVTSSGTNPICQGDTITLSLNTTVTNVTWNGTNNTNTYTDIPTANTTYTAIGLNGNCNFNTSLALIVHTLPFVFITPDASAICSGNTAALVAAGANTYIWDNSSTNDTLVSNPSSNTTYVVTGTNSFGCSNTATQLITVIQPALFTQNITICSGQWLPVGSSIYTSSGTYIDTLVGPNTCDSIVTTNLTVITLDYTTSTSLTTITSNENTPGVLYQWNDCNTENDIPGETNQSYTAIVNGDYRVLVTVGSCSDYSDCVTISSVGLSKINKEEINITVFPNPNNGAFTIKALAKGTYNLTNELGQVIQSFELNEKNNNSLTINELTTGVYFVIGTDNNFRNKIVVTK